MDNLENLSKNKEMYNTCTTIFIYGEKQLYIKNI